MEYAFEVDYIWLKMNNKLYGFLGHALHGMNPKDIFAILNMRGKTSSENLFKRKGLSRLEWLLPKIG